MAPDRRPGCFPLSGLHGRWKTSSINGACFLAHVQQFLGPTLKPKDIVAADILGSHKGKAVRDAVKSARARLFFPKYSPSKPSPS